MSGCPAEQQEATLTCVTVSSGEKGSNLERRIEEFFRLHGYLTQRNLVAEGKSGGKHEIDVLATKSDGVTDFKVLVESKAWSLSIPKDIVAKTAYVMGDLGIHKAIIVSLQGWTTGAETSAKQLGIELWGSDEIRDRLGQVAVAEIGGLSSAKTAKGLAIRFSPDQVEGRLKGQAGGILGIGREQVRWTQLLWFPFFLFRLSCSTMQARFLRGAVLKTIPYMNLYEALSGTFFARLTDSVVEDMALGTMVPVRHAARKIQREIEQVMAKCDDVVTETARQRYDNRLADLGIEANVDSVSIDHVDEVYVPFYVALLTRSGGERAVAIDAVWARSSKEFDETITTNLSFVRQVVEE